MTAMSQVASPKAGGKRKRNRIPSQGGSDQDLPDLVAGRNTFAASSSSSSSSSQSPRSPPHLASVPPSQLSPLAKSSGLPSSPYTSARYIDSRKGKRRALDPKTDEPASIADDTPFRHASTDASHQRSDHANLHACKFSRAGCPFVGTAAQVQAHEITYCTPLYTQLARSRAKQRSSSVEADPASSSSEVEALKAQIQHLQSDLSRLQAQFETEKRLRTDRLRKASERCLELMSLSELGEGKVEVLRMQLRAERELREKLEDELDGYRQRQSSV